MRTEKLIIYELEAYSNSESERCDSKRFNLQYKRDKKRFLKQKIDGCRMLHSDLMKLKWNHYLLVKI